jgi:hypothetical protein
MLRLWVCFAGFVLLAGLISSQGLAQTRGKSIFNEGGQSDPSNPTSTKAAVPEKAAQEAAERLVHELFQSEYADSSESGRRALADKLLAQAPKTDDLAERYVLLRESASVAALNGDVYATDLAVDHIAANYHTDAHEERLAAYRVLAARPGIRATLDPSCLAAAEAAISKDDFSTAEQFFQLLAKQPAPPIAARAAELRREIATRKEQADRVNAALAQLQRQPDDRQALAWLGRYYCLVKGDWPRGLPMLAKSGDSLRPLADAEIRASDAKAKLDAANQWYELRSRLSGSERAEVERHCAQLYTDISPQLTGLRQTLAHKRAAEVRSATSISKSGGASAKSAPSAATICFVCDASGSMMGLPFDLLKDELSKAVDALEPTQSFNICFFQKGEVVAFNKAALTPVTPANKSLAMNWLRRMVVASNSDPTACLTLALNQHPQVMYLLTDGAFDDNDAVAALIKQLNANKATRINTIEFVSPDAPASGRKVCEEVLKKIAKDNGGHFEVVITSDLSERK